MKTQKYIDPETEILVEDMFRFLSDKSEQDIFLSVINNNYINYDSPNIKHTHNRHNRIVREAMNHIRLKKSTISTSNHIIWLIKTYYEHYDILKFDKDGNVILD
jgi:hypothetical protein